MITGVSDEKQKISYSIICSSFLIWCMNKKVDFINNRQNYKRDSKDYFQINLIQMLEHYH